jgi:hypothetical protein
MTIVSFVTLLQRDDVPPFDVDMIRKTTELPRRWIKGQRRAPRILFTDHVGRAMAQWTGFVA